MVTKQEHAVKAIIFIKINLARVKAYFAIRI